MKKTRKYRPGYRLNDSKYRKRYRAIARAAHGAPPSRRWHCHHINGDRRNNQAENLIFLPPDFHGLLHQNVPIRQLPNRAQVLSLLAAHSEGVMLFEK